jgi:hypothetical protein
MDAAELDRIEGAQACLSRVRAESSGTEIPSLAGELMHHLDMLLRVVTGSALCRVNWTTWRWPSLRGPETLACVREDDGQRTATTMDSDIAFHGRSIPGSGLHSHLT